MSKLGPIVESSSHAAPTHIDYSYVTSTLATLIAFHPVTDVGDWVVRTKTILQHIEIEWLGTMTCSAYTKKFKRVVQIANRVRHNTVYIYSIMLSP